MLSHHQFHQNAADASRQWPTLRLSQRVLLYFASMIKVGAMPAELENPLPPDT
jgi:hypothetical protein